MTNPIRLGSRGSPLAVTQSRFVQSLLLDALGAPAAQADALFPFETFTTTGDRIQDRRLQEAGGKGLFTKELDEALLEDRIDAAVHSMKDLPTQLPEGLILACVPSREDPRDAFICASATRLAALPAGAVIGTASLRRQAQTLHLRPDVSVVMLRGNVDTRLRRIAEGEMHATYLANAGLTRLGLQDRAASVVPMDEMLPAAGQGALAIVCREDDAHTRAALARINLAHFEIATRAERSFLEALDGSCRTPIAAHATLEGTRLTLRGEVLTADGVKRWREDGAADVGGDALGDARRLGLELGGRIRTEAGDDLPKDVQPSPDPPSR